MRINNWLGWKYTLALGLLSLGTTAAHAQHTAFTATPIVHRLTGSPGEEVAGSVRVIARRPQGTKPGPVGQLRLRVYPSDWTLDKHEKVSFHKAGTLQDSCSKWVTVNPANVNIPGGSAFTVRYTVKIPANAQGSYRTMLMLEPQPEPRVPGRVLGVNSITRIACPIYVQVGPRSVRARVAKFSASSERAVLLVENTGNAPIRVKGKLKLQRADGTVVRELDIPSQTILTRSANMGELEVRGLSFPNPGAYTVTAILDYGGAALLGARTRVTVK